MKRDIPLFLKDIEEAASAIMLFTKHMGKAQFSSDDKTFSAVVRKLEIIGEAAKQIPSAIRSKIPLQWKKMAGMRDKLSHAYFGIDSALLWDVITKEIPLVRNEVHRYLKNFSR